MQKSWLYQVLCAVNLALVVVSAAEQKGNSVFLGKLAYPVYMYLFPLLRRVYRDSSFERNYLFFSMSLLLAAVIFLFVRILIYLPPLRSFLLGSAGVVSSAAYPFGCLWDRWQWLRISRTQAFLLLLEIIIVIICTILYLCRRWPLPGRRTLVLLTVHFCLWLWVSGSLGVAFDIARAYGPSYSGSWTVMINALLLPTLGFLASIAWAMYIKSTPSGDAEAA